MAQAPECDLPAGSVDAENAPAIAVVVVGYGPLVPSEWRDEVLPAARRTLARMRPGWRILDAAETRVAEDEAALHSARCGGHALQRTLRARFGNATTVRLLPHCDEDRCIVRLFGDDIELHGLWTLPRSASARAFARALARAPAPRAVGLGGGGHGGDTPFVLADRFGTWRPTGLDAARAIAGALAWPGECSEDFAEAVIDVAANGALREIGAWSSDGASPCIEAALARMLQGTRFDVGRGVRRLVLEGRPGRGAPRPR